MTNRTETLSQTQAGARATAVPQALLAILFGAFLVYGVGFAQPDVLHAAAHDTRHSAVLPCH